MPKEEFTAQGKYLWSLVKQAGWDRPSVPRKELRITTTPADKPSGDPGNYELPKEKPLSRFEAYLLKTFHATHMNALGEEEMRRAIRTLKPYADKARHDACKGIRQNIMAICTTYGWDKDELHSHMKDWKYGESLRELGYNELIAVRGHVRAALCQGTGFNAKAQSGKGAKR
jgi:hypothetical protein